jgi:hypothetical protein
VRTDKRLSQKSDKKAPLRVQKRGIVGYSKKNALLEEAITHMNTGKYGRSSAALKELLALDPQNLEARRLFATLHLRLGSLVTARQAFESLANEAIGRQDYWLAESLLREYLAAGPRCVPFLEQLAHVYQEKGDEMAAVAELGKAIEILRDDPDGDNPQKAAQLYSKIRELAPASSVALQLAPLFDVQTGEFLVRPSAPAAIPSDDLPMSDHALTSTDASPVSAVVEHPLPEVMPWEVIEETPVPETDAEVSSISASVEALDVPPPVAPEPLVAEAAPEEASFSYATSEPPPSDLPSDDALSVTATTPEISTAVPSPMPWEQEADASVQIPEPETPPVPDASAALESILASFRIADVAVTPAPAIEESSPPAQADNADGPAPPSSDADLVTSTPLAAPMPWEQVSDPGIQIPVPEPAPSPSPDATLNSGDTALENSPISPALPDVALAAEPIPPGFAPAGSEMAPASEPSAPSAPSAAETAAPSFSWNSVFDKAWKLTAGTMAPSPTVPPEKCLDSSDETGTENVAAEATISSPPEQEAVVPPAAPAMPVSFSSAVDEQAAPEAGSAPVVHPPALEDRSSAPSSHWNTGEVAVQVHRPSKKKKRWDKDLPETPDTSSPVESPPEPTENPVREWRSTSDQPTPPRDPEAAPQPDTRPDWLQATEAITFSRPEPAPPPQTGWSDEEVPVPAVAETASAAVVSAVETLFAPSAASDDVRPHRSWSKPRPRVMARLHRVRIAVSSFIGSCFSTTRSLTFLALMVASAVVVVAAAAIGAVAVMWMAMEDPPSPLYQTLTISPPRLITDAKKNGYLLLLGFDAPANQDPLEAGYQRRPDYAQDRTTTRICTGDDVKVPAETGAASDHMMKAWIRSGDPLTRIKGQGGTLKSLTSRESTALARYQQWLTMPFDDWGFGQSLSPNCTHVLLAHRLFVLDGFNQDFSTGLDRLEADMQAWRIALGQAKTLAMKMLAVTAVQDDASMASGLLSRVELDGAALTRLSKMIRPLDQIELSVRWPMQSQFVWATKSVYAEMKDNHAEDRPWHTSLAGAMRLPVQRRANAYADYYDAANKAVAGGRYTNLPKVSAYVRTPPTGVMDYLANPVEHILGIEPLPAWEPYVLRMIEADAQLRLAGLQAWLRRGPQDGDVPMRLAKAGQAYYDPFTGLPMLVNQRRAVIYSVGRDGKDQEGDDVRDVTAMIPLLSSESRRNAGSPSAR